uniref:DnaA N-terminal domain-containing protein n=1 Tax=Falsiroseomonas oryziterrae TaxID=2911368 RepID=UPI002351701D
MEKAVDPSPPALQGQVAEVWARIRGRLRDEVGEVEYKSWLRQMTLASLQGEEVVVLLPTRFLRDWVRGHYGDRLHALWQTEIPTVRRVEFRVMAEPRAGEPRAVDAKAEPAATPARAAGNGLAEPLGRGSEPRAEPRGDA